MNIAAASTGLGIVAMNAANQQAQVNAQVVASALEGAKQVAKAEAAPSAPAEGTGQKVDIRV